MNLLWNAVAQDAYDAENDITELTNVNYNYISKSQQVGEEINHFSEQLKVLISKINENGRQGIVDIVDGEMDHEESYCS